MIKRNLAVLVFLVGFSNIGYSAQVTFSFDLELERSQCSGFCETYPLVPDPATLTFQLELADPYASLPSLSPALVTRTTYGAPFPFGGPVDNLNSFAGTYTYDAQSRVATLEVTDYALHDHPLPLNALINIRSDQWSYDRTNYYVGRPIGTLGIASAFVGAPVPLPAALPLFGLALAGIAFRAGRNVVR